MIYYIIVIFSVALAALSQMLLKKSANTQHFSIINEYLNFWVIGGYCLLGISLVLNIFAMKNGVQIKEVGSIEALSYLFVPLLSYFFFNERLNKRKFISILIILIGIVVFFQ